MGIELEAGRELDALVAEKVMGWTKCDPKETGRKWEFSDEDKALAVGIGFDADGSRAEIPHYSSRIAAAWEVVEKIKSRFGEEGRFDVSYLGPQGADLWYAGWLGDDGQYPAGEVSLAHGLGDTAPLAICRAALKEGAP